MPRGRRPDPAAVQALKGNSRKRSRRELDRLQRAEAEAAKAAADPDATVGHATAGHPTTTGHAPIDDLAAHAATRPHIPPAPDRLEPDAATVWDKLAPDLVRLKFLRGTDEPAFERYCETLAAYWRNAVLLKEEGTVVVTSSPHTPNMLRTNPRFSQQTRLETILQNLEDRFGLNPQGRQRILLGLAARAPQLPFGDQPANRKPQTDGATDSAQAGAEAPAPQGDRAIGFLNPQRLN